MFRFALACAVAAGTVGCGTDELSVDTGPGSATPSYLTDSAGTGEVDIDPATDEIEVAVCSSCLTAPELRELPVQPITQHTFNLCWAASAQMCMDFADPSPDPDVSQNDQTNWAFHRSGGSHDIPPCNICDDRAWPDFDHFDYEEKEAPGPLSWTAIKHEINCETRPIATTFEDDQGRRHMVVVIGYLHDGFGDYVQINDPQKPQCEMSFIRYVRYVEPHAHSYYRVNKR
jgi:hypothetical protein